MSTPGISVLFQEEVFDPAFIIGVEDYSPYRHTLGLSPMGEASSVEILLLPLP